jgi:hypothetical protein
MARHHRTPAVSSRPAVRQADVFTNGKRYLVSKLDPSHKDWSVVERVLAKRNRAGGFRLAELYEVKWRTKPFNWSYYEFRKDRRFFFHGTQKSTIQTILDEGFKVVRGPRGQMLGPGIYAAYHTQKGRLYAPDAYVLSVMVYAPKTQTYGPTDTVTGAHIQALRKSHHAVEVRTGTVVSTPDQRRGGTVTPWKLRNHEICVFDPARVVPRYIWRAK